MHLSSLSLLAEKRLRQKNPFFLKCLFVGSFCCSSVGLLLMEKKTFDQTQAVNKNLHCLKARSVWFSGSSTRKVNIQIKKSLLSSRNNLFLGLHNEFSQLNYLLSWDIHRVWLKWTNSWRLGVILTFLISENLLFPEPKSHSKNFPLCHFFLVEIS